MLERLTIENIAIIDRSEIQFGRGLNVLTGETGAGKSIIMDSIGAVLGGRSSKDIIRTGQNKAYVEAVFDLSSSNRNKYNNLYDWFNEYNIEIYEEDPVIISREINDNGRNVCRVNGRTVPVFQLRQLGELLVDIHGQHENQSLLKAENHIRFLDDYAGNEISELLFEYKNILNKYRKTTKNINDLEKNALLRERQIDILEYELNEINATALKQNEDSELAKLRDYLSNSAKIKDNLEKIFCMLKGDGINSSVTENLNECIGCMEEIRKYDNQFEELFAGLEEIVLQLIDISDAVRRKKDEMDVEPGMLDKIEDRLDSINRLKRKYGKTFEEIHEYYQNAAVKLEELKKSEDDIKKYYIVCSELKKNLQALSIELDKKRKEAAVRLEEAVLDQLKELRMKGTTFNISIMTNEDEFNENGINTVEFLISTNLGEPLKPLVKIASGGELSRIMLAIKAVLAEVDNIPTLIFDEIDMGISGIAAVKVAEKLNIVSREHQVICVTHLAQIACRADNHYIVEKKDTGTRTTTDVSLLDGNALIAEIARLIDGGSMSDITFKHAKEMVLKAKCNRI